MFQLDDHNFKSEIVDRATTGLIVCYTPDWGLCKLVINAAEDLSQKHDSIKFYKMDIKNSKDIFIEYRVQKVPTVLYFKNGVLSNRLSDIRISSKISEQLENLVSGDFLIDNPLITEVTDSNYSKEVEDFPGIIILNFWVSGMDICWAMEKDLTALAKEYGDVIKVCSVNWREARDVATRFRISDIPTMVFLYRQHEEERAVGLKSKRSIENVVRHIAFHYGLI